MLSNFFFDKVHRNKCSYIQGTELFIRFKRLLKNKVHLKELPYIEITSYRRRRKGLLKYK